MSQGQTQELFYQHCLVLEFGFCLFAPLVKFELDLTEGFQS